jgi:predicted transcriptional regulator
MNWARAIRGLSMSERLVLFSLADFANQSAQCWPSQDKIAEELEVSSRTVWAALKRLTEAGIITRESRTRPDGSRTSDMFTLNMGQEPVAKFANTSRNICDTPSQSVPNPVANIATQEEPFIEPFIEPITTINARDPVDPNDWARMLAEATAAAGDQLDRTSPGVAHAAELRALVEPNIGEPCLWSEVLDAIAMVRTRSERTRKPIRSWSWIRDDAIKLRDIRLGAAMPGVVVPMVPSGAGPPSLSLPARIGAEVDRATARAREMFERENANHG